MVFFIYRVILSLQSRFEENTSKGNNTMLDENIRVMRREKGLTQEQLAEVMGEEELLAVAKDELNK